MPLHLIATSAGRRMNIADALGIIFIGTCYLIYALRGKGNRFVGAGLLILGILFLLEALFFE
jgi:hypothetical protein